MKSHINSKTVKIRDNVKIAYIEQGEGEVLIFLHGWTSAGDFYIKQIEELSDTYRVIAPDFRGHGKSSKPMDGHTCDVYAEDIKLFIEKLKLKDVVLVGWSLGASVIFEYINRFGDTHLKSICIVDQTPYPLNNKFWNLGAMKGGLDLNILTEIMHGIQLDYQKTMDSFMHQLFKDDEPEENVKFVVDHSMEVPPSIAACIFFDIISKDRRNIIHRINIPTLLIFSHVSRLGRETAEWMKSKILNSRLIYLKDCKNLPFHENAIGFNYALKEFLNTL